MADPIKIYMVKPGRKMGQLPGGGGKSVQDGYVKVMFSCFIWGTIGAFARWSGSDPLTISFLRCAIASLALYGYFYWNKHRILVPDRKSLLLVCLSGLFNAAGNIFFFSAIGMATLSHTLFVYYLGPVFIVILAPVYLKESLDIKSLLALFISLGGFLLILFSSQGVSITQELRGLLLAFAGAVCFSMMMVIAKAVKRVDALTFTFFQMMIASLALWPFFDIPREVNPKGILIIIILGLVHTAFAYSNYYGGLKKTKMQHAGILLYLDPVVASITGYLLFQEAIGLYGFIGGALIILAGTMVVTGQGLNLSTR